VINPNRMNRHGSNTAYKLVPGAAIPSMLDSSSPLYQRAPVIGHTVWVTAYDDAERWPAGDYPTQSSGDTGLTRWIAEDAPLVETDVVLWYVFGIHHITRIEDWPIMPVDVISFWLKPFGFFDQNPSLDAPNTMSSMGGHSHAEDTGR
jgi:primary-amine oxidase